MPQLRTYEPFMSKAREDILEKVQEAYDYYQKTKTIKFPTWLYGPPQGKLFKVEVEDFPVFGEKGWLEFDSARTAFMVIDVQVDFAGKGGYIDVMGYDLSMIQKPIVPIKACLDAVRGTDIRVINTREGHKPDLSDAPFNKILRSKLVGKGIGIGEAPEGGSGKLLVRGEKTWDTIDELYPQPGEYVIDKPTKGAFHSSNILLLLLNLQITHLVLTGLTADVCVSTIMREANDLGFWCLLLKDCTETTDHGNYLATIKQTKMSGGIFGWVSDSERFIKAIKEAGLK